MLITFSAVHVMASGRAVRGLYLFTVSDSNPLGSVREDGGRERGGIGVCVVGGGRGHRWCGVGGMY